MQKSYLWARPLVWRNSWILSSSSTGSWATLFCRMNGQNNKWSAWKKSKVNHILVKHTDNFSQRFTEKDKGFIEVHLFVSMYYELPLLWCLIECSVYKKITKPHTPAVPAVSQPAASLPCDMPVYPPCEPEPWRVYWAACPHKASAGSRTDSGGCPPNTAESSSTLWAAKEEEKNWLVKQKRGIKNKRKETGRLRGRAVKVEKRKEGKVITAQSSYTGRPW